MGLTVRAHKLDRHPLKLAFLNGVLDQESGKLWPGRPEDLITKAVPHEFTGMEKEPTLWIQTLLAIFLGCQQMVDFIQRLLGYSMTGLTTEHIFAILWGNGRNGKSLLINTVRHVIGKALAITIRPEMLLDRGGLISNPDGPTSSIMALQGCRLAIGSETPDRAHIATAPVKLLTGGDPLTGRGPFDRRQISFDPTHTLFLLTNHKPRVSADDFGFWERALLIPFRATFVNREPRAENERRADLNLQRKLEAEASQILGWMAMGTLLYLRDGLNPPPEVIAATNEYHKAEDILGSWIEERCILDPEASAQARELYGSFETWWIQTISPNPWKERRFGDNLSKRFEKKKSGCVYYEGIRLKQ